AYWTDSGSPCGSTPRNPGTTYWPPPWWTRSAAAWPASPRPGRPWPRPGSGAPSGCDGPPRPPSGGATFPPAQGPGSGAAVPGRRRGSRGRIGAPDETGSGAVVAVFPGAARRRARRLRTGKGWRERRARGGREGRAAAPLRAGCASAAGAVPPAARARSNGGRGAAGGGRPVPLGPCGSHSSRAPSLGVRPDPGRPARSSGAAQARSRPPRSHRWPGISGSPRGSAETAAAAARGGWANADHRPLRVRRNRPGVPLDRPSPQAGSGGTGRKRSASHGRVLDGASARGRRGGPPRRSALAAAAEVALELAGDRLAAGLGELGGVLGLLQAAHVAGDVGVLGGQLVDAVLP